MEIEQIAPHLWWWTAPHPEWSPSSFKNGRGWERDVSSYALVEDGSLVLFDPLVPADDDERFWSALDDDVEHHGPPSILISLHWHARSAGEIVPRYEGASVWAHEPAAGDVAKRVAVSQTFADGDPLPGGVEALAMGVMNEAAFWLPGHRALVLGDSLLGYEGRTELCPRSWLGKSDTMEELEASVRRALARGPERLLLTHGGPRDPAELQL